MTQPIIIRSGKEIYQCQLPDRSIIEVRALPSLLSQIQPVVGDKIVIELQGEHHVITSVLPRHNEVYRLLIREKKKKVIASNLDLLIIVVAVSKPAFKRGLLDRYLLRSLQWELPAIVIFNKMDEFTHDKIDLVFEKKRLAFMGVKSYEVSALSEEQFDIKELKQFIEHKCALFVGQSGVGKSKIISTLSGGEYDLLSAELAKVGKGAHTTTWAELLRFKNFSLIDSPGIRTMSMEDIFVENLPYYFQDIVPWIEKCQFADCRHQENSKGCGFRSLDQNIEEQAIVLSRLESFQRLFEELSQMPSWMKKK